MPDLIAHVTDHTYAIKGAVTFANVVSLREMGFVPIQNHEHLVIDFSECKSSSSALVALLIGWLRFAKKNNTKLAFKALPEPILDIIQISGLKNILPII